MAEKQAQNASAFSETCAGVGLLTFTEAGALADPYDLRYSIEISSAQMQQKERKKKEV